jgi:hypothetical protein
MCLRCGVVQYPYRSWPSGPAGPATTAPHPTPRRQSTVRHRPAGSLGSELGAATIGWPRAGGTGAGRLAGTSSPGCASSASHPSITNGRSCPGAGTGCAGLPRPSPAVHGRRLARRPLTGRLRVAAAKMMRRYSTGSDRQMQRAAGFVSPYPSGAALGRAPPESHGQQRRTTVSRPRRSCSVLRRWSDASMARLKAR